MMLGGFFSPEAGQKRRQWLDERMGALADGLDYYAGPTGIPQKLGALAELASFTDAGDVVEAADASRTLWNEPSVQNAARYAASGAALALPFIGGKAAGELAENTTRWLADEDGAIRAWHGSPHDFDRFSMDKIGTGEGAQAYGHGLYFADSRDVALNYREALKNRTLDYTSEAAGLRAAGITKQSDLDALQSVMGTSIDADVALRDWSNWTGTPITPKIRAAVSEAYAARPRGRLYEVEIAANPEDFLDWDAPLSAQPEKVRGWFDSRGISEGFAGNQRGVELFQAERRAFDDEAALAASMKDAGLAGVQYLDHGSRFNAMDGLGPQTNTRNYVVFDDKLISILNKYGLAGILGLSASQMLPEEQQQY